MDFKLELLYNDNVYLSKGCKNNKGKMKAIKKSTKRSIGKNMMPIFFLLGCLITFTISLLAYSSTYAVVTYGSTNTPPSLISAEGYYASITLPKSVNYTLSGSDMGQLVRTDANVSISTNSVTGYKMYISIENAGLRTNAPVHEIPYDNQTNAPVQKSDLNTNTWGIFLKKNGLDYVIPLCNFNTLSNGCLVSESNGPITNNKVAVDYGVKVDSNTPPGTYRAYLVYSAVVNSSVTGEFPIKEVQNAKVPLLANGDTVTNSAEKKLKHKFRIQVPLIENDQDTYHRANYIKRYKVTMGGVDCEPQTDDAESSRDGFTFNCIADFSTASPRFQPGQKAEMVVETKPYGYLYSKQNAVEFVAAESTFHYTGTPQEMVAPIQGKYFIEAMGANGGDRTAAQATRYWYGSPETFLSGKGGYSAGYKDFAEGEKTMVFVGGKGQAGNDRTTVGYNAKGGFNGGGNGSTGLLVRGTTLNDWGAGGGGGGSDLRPDVQDYGQYHNLRYKPGNNPSGSLLNDGPWANIEHGTYQAVIKTTNLPDADFEGLLAYYDFGYHYLPDVYYQKFGDYILVYFNYPVGSPAATHLPSGNPGPAIEIRLKVKTTNQIADITSIKFYRLEQRIIVAGGGAGGSLCFRGGHGGGIMGGQSKYLGSTSDPDYNNIFSGTGGTQTTGGGSGFGASAPIPANVYPKIANAVLGRPGAGGGWTGGFTGQGAYDEHQTCAGAGGGSGYIGGVQNGTTYGYGETGFSIAPWTSLEPADKNGIVKMKVTDYSGGVE